MVESGKQSLLARVSIVDRDGKELLDKYVKPTSMVTDYRTPYSGITKQDLDNGKPFSQVQMQVADLIRGKILVGHSLDVDLGVLDLPHPEVHRRDLAKYRPFMMNDKDPHSLKFLAQKHLGKVIQEGKHDSVIDAKTAMELYNSVANKWN